MACCKAHKETCSTSCSSSASTVNDDEDSSVSSGAVSSSKGDLQSKLNSSTRLQEFLAANPYLQTQLPVLLARVDRQEPAGGSSSSRSMSELARDLERKERVGRVLREAVDMDPIVAELYEILQEEALI